MEDDRRKRIAILGSTGSIGQQTLEVVRALPDQFRIVGLAAGKNIGLLAKQIEEFRPRFAYSQSDDRQRWSLEDMACHPDVDIVVIAISGKAGLLPTLAAVRAGKNVALANKESLVMAGELITREAILNGAQILPVDSEHSAIWQCINGEPQTPSQIILTASGGPFRLYLPPQLRAITVEQALNHPTWQMGKKVTIDSATLMNKGLEVIEAHWLFDMPFDRIKVLVHPQSIIHSMVEFIDGSIKALLSPPDMRFPIQYALSHPDRLANPQLPRLDWSHNQNLTFEQPDMDVFPCLKLAIEAGIKGGTYPAVLSGADEMAVELFLSHRIKFTDIPILVEQALSTHQVINSPTLEEIIEAENWARKEVNHARE